MRSGHTKSCGCFNRDAAGERGTTHGLYKHRLYAIWGSMKSRCLNQKKHNYHHYGGRGITVCPEWLDDAAVFIEWAEANGAAPGLQIDRIDNDGGYSPDNCRFVTPKENMNNRRCSKRQKEAA